ncbi:hydrogenase maturation nickel metallochaperone HypA [Picosynechococcus sp. PCC 11901]|uniref:hydrogenase maturation nickel metallochaperone HypA n=1 Tax=Picosynechococcus sp. PCC 11901 TaxID=2579791 RepID=UPI0010FC1752|nr:hydrogenase maturation nickel metallochaperone HypA [Picosynechococcus sp. PCC 11901]QCS48857.1 hydrogenase maturation nickel metallochaperone HypA [Picosynechococcus sp. PCC 11901]
MHEVAIMTETVAIACASAEKQNAAKILNLTMRIGAISSVVPEALSFAFEAVASGTLAEQAKLIIETVPVTCYCAQCDRPFIPPNLFYECPLCSSLSQHILSGKEVELKSLEVI